MPESHRDHRPGMPEVALRFGSHMASCSCDDGPARTSSCRPTDTKRMCRAYQRAREQWDSGLRPVPPHALVRATVAVTENERNRELLSLDQLARELGVHQRTLRAAARTGRLRVTFSSRSAFGRPIRLATRADGQAFMRKDYRRYGGQSTAVAPLPSVPHDYDERLQRLRRRLRLTQGDLARRIGAANKTVVYQWESRKRTPSPVFWKRVEALGGTKRPVRRAPMLSSGSTHHVVSEDLSPLSLRSSRTQ
jgi:ribosome-binding protein aMBF1 (putative translation factor)